MSEKPERLRVSLHHCWAASTLGVLVLVLILAFAACTAAQPTDCSLVTCTPSASTATKPTSSAPSTTTSPNDMPVPTNMPPACSNDEIYLAVGAMESATRGETNQIWQMDIDGAFEKLIYQAPRHLSITGSDMLLPETVQKMREHFEKHPEYPNRRFPDIESLTAYVTIDHLALSPDRRSLAWAETYRWCPGNYCYGEARIKVLQMDSENMVIDRRANLWVTSLAWAPNNQILVFSEQFKISGTPTYTLNLLDVRNGQSSIIGNEAFPALSPDGQHLVAIDQAPHMVAGLDMISLNDYSKQAVTLPIWTFISTPTWSPDGAHIAFAGRTADRPMESETSIYTLNLQTLELITITTNIDLHFFDNPHWAPDGNLIAADAGEDSSQLNHLIVLDSQSGQVVSDFVERRSASSWRWSDDGQNILFIRGIAPEMRKEIAIFHVPTGNLTTLPVPEGIRDDYYDDTIFLSDITW